MFLLVNGAIYDTSCIPKMSIEPSPVGKSATLKFFAGNPVELLRLTLEPEDGRDVIKYADCLASVLMEYKNTEEIFSVEKLHEKTINYM